MREILVIEDDENLISLMKHKFSTAISTSFNYSTSFKDALNKINQKTYDLYIIDLNLEGYSGFEIVKLLQKEVGIDNRIIIISKDDSVENQIEAYNLGASNFLIKPLNFDILTAILKKNLRSLDSSFEGLLKFSDLVIDSRNRTCHILSTGNGQSKIHLTTIEFNLLYKLAKTPNKIHHKEDLIFHGKNEVNPMSFKALEMHIASLRKKIGRDKIITSRGLGYYYSNKK